MSETEKNDLPATEENNTKEIKKPIQWLIGIAAGILTSVSIYFSGRDLGIQDALISKIMQYLFLIVFAAFMITVRQLESKRGLKLNSIRTAYFVGMIPGLLVFLYLALSQGLLSCAS